MNQAIFRANGDFRQSTLEYFRKSRWSASDNAGTPRMPKEHLLEQMRRVPQAPKIRETFAGLEQSERQNRLERENIDRFIYK